LNSTIFTQLTRTLYILHATDQRKLHCTLGWPREHNPPRTDYYSRTYDIPYKAIRFEDQEAAYRSFLRAYFFYWLFFFFKRIKNSKRTREQEKHAGWYGRGTLVPCLISWSRL